jgi:hypothetical protein
MRIGIDFDNTIIRYDGLFHALALERNLIPASLPTDKTIIRNHIRSQGGEHDWILLQGLAYGKGISGGIPFPGVQVFFKTARLAGHKIIIISHKTQYPHKGEQVDLRQAALDWLLERCLLDSRSTLGRTLFFESEREDKIQRIADCGCDYFIDDLPDFLAMPGFPKDTTPCLFDPGNNHLNYTDGPRFGTWEQAGQDILQN